MLDRNIKSKILVLLYTICFFVISILYTPYKQFYYDKGHIFTGVRGFQPIFAFNELKELGETLKGKNVSFIYYIDFQLLFVELLTLTIIFAGLYFIFKKPKSKEKE